MKRGLMNIAMVVGILVLLTGCYANRYDAQTPIQVTGSPVEFPTNYRGVPPIGEPSTWNEAFDAGTFLFAKGMYSRACEYFLLAADLAEGEARRTSLTAASVSALGANDSAGFLEYRKQAQEMTEENPFRDESVTDRAIKALHNIQRD